MRTVIFPVKALESAKAVFGQLLGAEPVVDQPYYVQFEDDGLTVGLDPNGHRLGTAGPVCYWHVDDIKAKLNELVTAGATEAQPVKEVGGGRLTALVKDADPNPDRLIQR